MRVHHLNCVTMCPPGGRLMDGRRRPGGVPAALVCHCLLVETNRELVLVDTGFGLEDVRDPNSRLSPLFLEYLCRPQLNEEMTALRQLQRLGFDPGDVRHILLTHLDFDHAGGLDDFPAARVHVMAPEVDAAMAQTTWLDRRRFRPRQWTTQPHWVTYPMPRGGERWFGFECVRELDGLPPEFLLVPLVGHTLGHSGVAVQTPDGWLLHAGDAYFYHQEMDPDRPQCTPGLWAYQELMQKDGRMRKLNQERLRELVRRHDRDVRVFCAHDAVEFERLEEDERAHEPHALRGLSSVEPLVPPIPTV
ncbi:MBL fold metallo-hydrolase [Vitiosangium sp. GDMCC 1.1324]|uniref:MBL fold metallo-hydrolase n=1 Tax=Vitiosangium sp. (strain GDMCC 1.1324) TaxID=2138576 RepID=UPI000D359080|nr:MBL fold metallo-hydrolase [Vitiosangium sp. GDMCC 1.1324]PTL77003.1 MBL fold metallo-hydrolase [Vitiosangium sp. GDMCC 1.1324]